MSTLSTVEMARIVGVSPRRLLAIAKARGVESERVPRGPWRVWRKAQARLLRPGPPGNPDFVRK